MQCEDNYQHAERTCLCCGCIMFPLDDCYPTGYHFCPNCDYKD